MKKIENLLDVSDASKYVGCSRQQFYMYVKAEMIDPVVDMPRHKLYRKIDLDKLKRELNK